MRMNVIVAWLAIAGPAISYFLLGIRNVGVRGLVALLWLHSAAIRPIRMWVVALAGFFLLWEAACRAFAIPTFILPPPSLVWAAFVQFQGPIIDHAHENVVGFDISMNDPFLVRMLHGTMSANTRNAIITAINAVLQGGSDVAAGLA